LPFLDIASFGLIRPTFLAAVTGDWPPTAGVMHNLYSIPENFTPFRGEYFPLVPERSCGPGQMDAMAQLTKTVVMVGMMGAGKTAVGTALARLLGVEFRDSDEEITRAANRSIAEIFERDGEAFFRARETEVISRLLRGNPCVLSTGGGAFLSATNRSLIHDVGVSVWLRADLDLLWQRVRHKTTRPLLRTPNPRETLRTLYEARLPFYAEADLAVDSAADLSVDDMALRVREALRTRPDVLEG
jgi:shikimate kinase